MGGRSQKEIMQGGVTSKQLADERDGENNEIRLQARIVKLEEQTKWMYDKMMAAAEPNTWDKGIPWRHEDEGDEWRKWEGSWWIRVNQDDLNSRKRRRRYLED